MKNYAEDYDDYEYAEDYKFEYIIDGIEVDLIGDAYPSCRGLPYNPDNRLFEMEALAKGRDHRKYLVRWSFEPNGEESFDDYDYSEPYDCVLIG